MTTHRIFHVEAAQKLADRLRTARHIGQGWNRISDRDFERESRELQFMSQTTPRIF